jgi:hypothetical protein
MPTDRRIVHPRCCPTWFRVAAFAAVAAGLAIAMSSAAIAQTLTDPNPSTARSQPKAAATKSHQTGRVKNCSIYGPGFMVMPGTDMCIKVGGGVTVEAGH